MKFYAALKIDLANNILFGICEHLGHRLLLCLLVKVCLCSDNLLLLYAFQPKLFSTRTYI